MGASGRYDGGLQMFVDEAREPDRARLAFLRWLGERGRLEREVFGPSLAELAERQESQRAVAESARLVLAR